MRDIAAFACAIANMAIVCTPCTRVLSNVRLPTTMLITPIAVMIPGRRPAGAVYNVDITGMAGIGGSGIACGNGATAAYGGAPAGSTGSGSPCGPVGTGGGCDMQIIIAFHSTTP